MALLNQTTQVYNKLGDLFDVLRKGQAPEKFNREFLKDLGFKSSNWHAAIALFKGLGLVSEDGSPTPLYMEFLDPTKWQSVLGEAVGQAYSDIFVIKKHPEQNDLQTIVGKYKSTYNLSETQADRAARTFLALYELSDKDAIQGNKTTPSAEETPVDQTTEKTEEKSADKYEDAPKLQTGLGLSYNIQIHLPATKDIEVYNSIFKSLREHLID